MKTEKEIIEELKKHDDAYYNGNAFISDSNYDSLREEAQTRFPDNDYFKTIGASIKFGEKIEHKNPMLSLDRKKADPNLVIDDWWNKKIGRYSLIGWPKFDGVSGKLIYNNGELKTICTRGNGKFGRIITHVKDYIDIPKIVDKNDEIEVIGEFILPIDNTYTKENLRQNCSGLLGRKNHGLEDLKHVIFVAYGVNYRDGEFFKCEEHKIKFLQANDFEIGDYVVLNRDNELKDYYNLYVNKLRKEWNYETDGLVFITNDCSQHDRINSQYIVDHHPHHAIALKPPSKSKETYVTGINYQMSRHGNLIPVLEFNPIEIDGVNIERCTLNNYGWVKRENFHHGDIIEIERANDVIPQFVKKVKNCENNIKIEIPIICPSCKTILIEKGVHLHCPNNECLEQIFQQILYWCTKAEMEGFAESTLRLLYEEGLILSIKELYELNNDTVINYMKELDGLGNKKIKNIIEQIEKSRTCSISDFIDRLGIEQVGKKAVKKMDIKTIDDFWNFNDSTYVIGQKLIEYVNNNKDFITSLVKVLNITEEKNILNNKGDKMEKVCMTGKGPDTRKNLIEKIEEKGYEFQSSVNKETNILICEDPSGNSFKLQKARKFNVHLMSYDEFFGE